MSGKGSAGFTGKLTKTVNKMPEVIKAMNALEQMDVLVGIPQAKSGRGAGGSLTNAELAYIHTEGVYKSDVRDELQQMTAAGQSYSEAVQAYRHSHGDPLFHIPPRPFLQPSIMAHKKQLTDLQADAFKAALAGDLGKAVNAMKRTGLAAQNFAKAWFTDPRNKWAPNAPSTIAAKGSDKPLIDTGKLRNAIAYVLRQK